MASEPFSFISPSPLRHSSYRLNCNLLSQQLGNLSSSYICQLDFQLQTIFFCIHAQGAYLSTLLGKHTQYTRQ